MKLVKFRDNAPKVIVAMSVSGAPREVINQNYRIEKWRTLYTGFNGTWAAGVFTRSAGNFGATEELENAYAYYDDDLFRITSSTAGGAVNHFHTTNVGFFTGESAPDTAVAVDVPILTKPTVYLNDMEFQYAADFVDITRLSDQDVTSGNLTDDKTDQFRGEMTAAADLTAVDGMKWWRMAFSVTRRQISAISEDHDYWLTFENPYLDKNTLDPNNIYLTVNAAYLYGFAVPPGGPPYGSPYAPRYPAVWDLTSPPGPDPYRDPTSPDLIDQPYDVSGYEYAYPKSTRITAGISIELDLPLYGNFIRDAWVRPVSTAPGDKATAYVYAY